MELVNQLSEVGDGEGEHCVFVLQSVEFMLEDRYVPE